jgi:YHS domain-containing protein
MKAMITFVSAAVLAIGVTAAGVFAQAAPAKPQDKPTAAPEQKAPTAAEKVTAVFLGNANCTQTNKPVDKTKFVEVDGQRIYMCCDKCADGVKKDTKTALAKAYPTATPVVAKNCACGKALEAGKTTDATFQGQKVSLCCADCATAFKKSPVTMIALLMHPDVTDAKNATDPIDGKPVDATIVAIYKTHLVHFSSWTSEAAFEKDPATSITKLKLSN